MFQVHVPIPLPNRLGIEMQAMRTWLDRNRLQPAAFSYLSGLDGLTFVVIFTEEAEALAFASEFGGRLTENSSSEQDT